jgi:hypothetical protein
MINIELPIFWLALLVPTKKKNTKPKKSKHLIKKQIYLNTKNKRLKTHIEHIDSKMDQIHVHVERS